MNIHNFILVTISSKTTKVHEKLQMATHGASIDHWSVKAHLGHFTA